MLQETTAGRYSESNVFNPPTRQYAQQAQVTEHPFNSI